jgi:hypothetical protein
MPQLRCGADLGQARADLLGSRPMKTAAIAVGVVAAIIVTARAHTAHA